MEPARWPRPRPDDGRLLVVDPAAGRWTGADVADLPSWLRPGDLLVVNDAATWPASLPARAPSGRALEVRLASGGPGPRFRAVLFGPGDWRTPTERRPPPDGVRPGDALDLGGGLGATVAAVSRVSPRLVELTFDRSGAPLVSALYARGSPVQYSYLAADLPLDESQTAFASRPWAVEPPSAGRPLSWGLLGRALAAGVGLARVTHGAGLSSTGDPDLDAALPLPEAFEVPEATAAAARAARRRGGRVVAVGTSTARALEGAARAAGGTLRPMCGETDLRIGPGFRPRVVAGLLSGMHARGESHFEMLRAFCPEALLDAALEWADRQGYRAHEFGDSCLVLPGSLGTEPGRSAQPAFDPSPGLLSPTPEPRLDSGEDPGGLRGVPRP